MIAIPFSASPTFIRLVRESPDIQEVLEKYPDVLPHLLRLDKCLQEAARNLSSEDYLRLLDIMVSEFQTEPAPLS